MTNDGGPAFPRPASEFTKNGTLPDGNDAVGEQDGMSLRDWFAGLAMQGILAGGLNIKAIPSLRPAEVAEAARKQADALVAELRKPL